MILIFLTFSFKPVLSLSSFTLIKRLFSSSSLSAIRVVQFSSVTRPCPTLCDPINCSMPGFAVHHQLVEFVQSHVHRVSDAIQPSHLLSFPSPVFNVSQHQSFSNESVLHTGGLSIGVSASASVLPMNIQDWFPLGLTGLASLQSKRPSRVFPNTTVQKH